MSDLNGRPGHEADEPERAFFGRRKGKRLRGLQERRLAELLPEQVLQVAGRARVGGMISCGRCHYYGARRGALL